ncbi:unnamed protein product [Bursaphelenchus xylophilus]|uniref:(pine wood nematode) hypothetical protein n=1 Tax=Bursaphelenchus xylophilus TaxID=6326 RepID=A0A7I8WGY0_BURXY|nr:unnamed protein product [Bursaphelenchus xylophilus]CAG9110440.1 unnamed protein product [Bursaphelenchus xylophilus]
MTQSATQEGAKTVLSTTTKTSTAQSASTSSITASSKEARLETTATQTAKTVVKNTSTSPTSLGTSAFTTSPLVDPGTLADLFGLSSNDNQVTINANMLVSMQIVAAGLTQTERDEVSYQLPELISTCTIDGRPCNMDRDFDQRFDVDYGYCYTFNYAEPSGFYNATNFGADHGLQIITIVDEDEYLESTEFQGVKVVVHPQNTWPFPNQEGYFARPGAGFGIMVRRNSFSRLGKPYGLCDTLDSISARKQQFLFNGTYSTEGCLRSCFQTKIAETCGCFDARFPEVNDTEVCTPVNADKYKCYTDYIEKNGDYYFADCECDSPCQNDAFGGDVVNFHWPHGPFFVDKACANLSASEDCIEYYRKNTVLVQVYFTQFGYESLEESPDQAFTDLLSNLYGNTGLWIGWCIITVGELVLTFLQMITWICRTKYEIPEVPSCRRRNYPECEEDEEENTAVTASGEYSCNTNAVDMRNIMASKRKSMKNHANTDKTSSQRPVDLDKYCGIYEPTYNNILKVVYPSDIATVRPAFE